MYVARDKDGDLYLYKTFPKKNEAHGYWKLEYKLTDGVILDSSLFPEVRWEDEEPTEVELVKKGE